MTEGVVVMPGSIADIQGDIFYIEHRAPYVMTSSHVHGHVELNYLIGCSATYIVDGRVQKVPENRLALFWANMPHRLIVLEGEGKLFNLYVPLPEFLQWSGDHPGSGRVKGAHHVSTMVRFIGENLHNPISTADVANHLGLHRNYTTNLFSSVMGVSIKQYLQFQRLQKVQLLLLDSERPIGEIGLDCGFSSLSRFYEAFQRYFGMPPGQFRKKLL